MLFHRTPGRRRLRFGDYQGILAEVSGLACGHQTLGNWTLAQICNHLADTQEFSVESGEPDIKTSALYRTTVGRIALGALLWFRWIPERQGDLTPPAAAEFETALSRLQGTIRRISSEPMIARHPIFGRLSQGQWRQFHLHHAAHHLGFVIPT